MKLFVWDEALTDYTDGVMFATAETVDEARAALRTECDYIPEWELAKEPKVYEMTERTQRVVWGGS